jgi:acyl-CoA thioester hydrolase
VATVNPNPHLNGNNPLKKSDSLMTKNILEETITPGFYETDALGHINNTVVPMWFEKARTPLFKIFTPDLDPKKWELILAKIEVEYVREIDYRIAVIIKTGIQQLGNSSFLIRQELFQDGELAARGLTTLVHFDHHQKKSQALTTELRSELEKYYWPID